MNKPGLTPRLEQYFRANPDEEMTPADIAEKFGSQMPNVYACVRKLSRRGLLEYARVVRLRERGVAR